MYQIDAMSREPMYEQLMGQIEHYILRKVLMPGQKLPSIRSLSATLALNPNTIQKTYMELERRGVILAVSGRGYFVSQEAVRRIGERKRQNMGRLTEEIHECALAGIEKNDVMACVDRAYQPEQIQDEPAEDGGDNL